MIEANAALLTIRPSGDFEFDMLAQGHSKDFGFRVALAKNGVEGAEAFIKRFRKIQTFFVVHCS